MRDSSCEFEMEKIASFELDFNFYVNPKRTSHRLSLSYVTYHSQYYKRIGAKRCNYAVKDKTDNNSFKFGLVKCFLQINDRVLVAITELKIIGNIIDKIGGRTSNALIYLKLLENP